MAEHFIHIPTPGDHYSPGTGSAVMTVIYELTRQHEAAGGETTIVVGRGTFDGYPPYPVGNPSEVDFGPLPDRRRKMLDVIAGRLGLGRPNICTTYRPALKAIPADFEGYLFVHNAPGVGHLFRKHLPRARLCLYMHNRLFDTYGRRELSDTVNTWDHLICVSRFLKDYVASKLGRDCGKCSVVLNGVDTGFLRPVPRQETEVPTVLFLGRVIPEKGVDLLVRAAVLLKERGVPFRLEIVGSSGFAASDPLSEYEEELRQLAVPLGEQVSFQPFVRRDEILHCYGRADIFCVPSNWDDPCPLTALEGLACGLPSVMSRRGGVPEIGLDAVLYFNPPDHVELADRLEEFLKNPPLREEYSRRARARAEQLTWQNSYETLIHSLSEAPNS